MRVVFMGTPDFAATILEELAFHHDVACVYTRPDAVRSRGKELDPSPVKAMAESRGIPVRTPQTLKDPAVQQEIASWEPDAICVAAYGMILPKEVLDIPVHGCLNVHASLLPRWRGAAPVERALLAGDEETGVCIMKMEEGLDTGPYCVYRTAFTEGKYAPELSDELANLGAHALLTALNHIEEDALVWIDQPEEGATYASKIEKGELALDPNGCAEEECRKVRAASAAHPSRCEIAGKTVSVERARLLPDDDGADIPAAGRAALIRKRLVLGFAEGAIEVERVKPDGKSSMDATSFASGIQGMKANGASWGHVGA